MGNLASGHFKPTNKIQAEHNDRTLSPSYLIPQEFRGQNEVNRHSKQAIILKNQIIENAHQTYLITFKQKSQAKSYQWSLVVNIKTDTTMSDLEKLAEHFEIKYGFQCYQIAIHRDEGYMDENNQPHINHHAHMEFITLNKENGKNMMRKAYLSPKNFREIQTEIAQILGMERGTDKRVSGTERIEPHKYAQMKNQERKKLEDKDKTINELQERPTTEQYSQLERANSEQAQTIQAKDKEIATLNTLNDKLEKTNKDLLNITKQYLLLDLIYDNPTDEKTEKKAEDYKHLRVFTKLWNAINLLLKILKKLFGDEKTKKDHQDILNTISELQERPTKQELEAKEQELNTLKQERTDLKDKLQAQEKTINELNQFKNSSNLALDLEKAQERIQTLESNETALKNDLNAKDKEINTLKQERTDLKDKLQAQEKTINELNQFKNSSNLALDLEKAQERIQTLESNEIALIDVLCDKENIIQNKGRTINRLKKELKELEYNYNQERERMKAENKHLQEQGLEKTYTQKDYEDLKKAHHQEVEALKKQIQEYKTQETYTPTKRM
ncbi:hypothetical protein ACOWK8_07845 [Helicobacter pylori]